MFDPATLRNATVNVDVGRRELVRGAGAAPIPAFRVEMEFAGLRTTSWITDTGEVVREESPLGLITVRESAETRAGDGGVAADAGRPARRRRRSCRGCGRRFDEPRDVRRMRMRLGGADLSPPIWTAAGSG